MRVFACIVYLNKIFVWKSLNLDDYSVFVNSLLSDVVL